MALKVRADIESASERSAGKQAESRSGEPSQGKEPFIELASMEEDAPARALLVEGDSPPLHQLAQSLWEQLR